MHTKPLKRYGAKGPEAEIQRSILRRLILEGWYALETHGNMYQYGFPDLFATHTRYGQRWIEVKLPDMKGSTFTPAQLDVFPKLCAYGSGVWILTGNSDYEFCKLHKPCNWAFYLK